MLRLLEFGFCLPVRRACAACLPDILDRQAARQADGTLTGNLFVICRPAGKAGNLSFACLCVSARRQVI